MLVAATSCTACFVGDGPKQTGGFGLYGKMVAYAGDLLKYMHPTKVISGMDLGFETAVAEAALGMGIPLVAASPCCDWDKKWIPSSQRRYREILAKASESVVVSAGDFSWDKVDARSRWMVERSDIVFALWMGDKRSTVKVALDHAENKRKIVIPVRVSWEIYRNEGLFTG